MAAPIGHIYLALRLLASPLMHDIDQQAFIIGASFPDIRYAAHVPREYTHILPITLREVLAEHDPFKAGMLFHSWVDKTHEFFYKQHNIFNQLPNIPYNIESFKCAEDSLIAPLIQNHSFIAYFDTILPQELALIDQPTIIKQWHNMLKNYLKDGPTIQAIYQLFTVGKQQDSKIAVTKNYIFASALYTMSRYLAHQKILTQNIMLFYQTVGDALEHGQEPSFIPVTSADEKSLAITAHPA